jgi:hypothetical protein
MVTNKLFVVAYPNVLVIKIFLVQFCCRIYIGLIRKLKEKLTFVFIQILRAIKLNAYRTRHRVTRGEVDNHSFAFLIIIVKAEERLATLPCVDASCVHSASCVRTAILV